ncbi:MAG: hypothetical protein IJQ81_06290 [Oscillibacter sp.]|nr:hypothetical protein [Oscillibacter sp.]
MNCFLVDYENVHANGLNGISGLSEEDTVIIFYSEKAETMTFGLHRRLNESKAQISFQRVSTGGKNALDFQLCTYLGYLICQNAQSLAAYYIVSGDSDYEALTVYWKRHNVNVSLIPEIAAFSAPVKSPPESAKEPSAPVLKPSEQTTAPTGDLSTQLKAVLPAKYHAQIPVIADIIRRCKTRQNVHTELMRTFHQGADTSVPKEIYQSVKPLVPGEAEYLQTELKAVLAEKYHPHIYAIVGIIQRYKTKQEIHVELQKAFHEGADNRVPSEIYQSIKPLLTDKA